MKKIDLAYYAGIFDGEGCIVITLQKTYVLRCKVSNTNEWLVQSLKMSWGGCIYKEKRSPNRKTCYDWFLTGGQAGRFLKDIYPYLRLKKPEADVALQFQEQRQPNPRKRGLTDEQRAVSEAQRILMANLKRV